MKSAWTLLICVGFSIGCSDKPTSSPATPLPSITVQAEDIYTFHLDAESTRLVVLKGDELVEWDELSNLCLQLNNRSNQKNSIIIQGLQLSRRELDGTENDLNMAVEGSIGTAVVYLQVNNEWREVVVERFDAGFKSCTMGPKSLVESLVPPQ